MINLSFDNGTVEQFTLVLSQRDYTHLGQISNIKGLKFKANLNGANELSFDVYKELDGHEEILWDDIYDLRLIWIPELNEYFEIDVESTDQVYVVKTVTAKSLCESELSQTYLHNIEINTADDIAREDYDANYPTVFYRELDPSSSDYEKLKNASLLHRIMDKVPAYSIGHVDDTLRDQQRVFSISDTSLYDFMVGECSEQFNCLFQFDSATRTVSAYDLQSTCHSITCPYYLNNHLHYRGLFNDRCPICGSTDISSFGEDTTVFVSTENLTDEVKFDTDVASMKNCFRLEAGDDNMTAAVINSNPNGTQYIYEFNAESKKDMPAELVNLIDSYDVLYDEYNNTRNMNLNTSLISEFNALCNKYNNSFYEMGAPWNPITVPVYGYKNLIPHYYNCIDFYQYLKSGMMPIINIEQKTVQQELADLISQLGTIGMSTQPTVQATVESAITNLCKLYFNTGLYKIKVNTTSWSSSSWTTWRGTITLTSFEDDNTTSTSSVITRTITTDYATFMDQKISKYIKRSKESTELYNALKIPALSTFRTELKKYSAVRLQSFHDALAAVLGILIEAGQGVNGSTLYSSFYTPYYNKLVATETELNTRNHEIEIVNGIQDINGNSTKKGVLQYILDSINAVQAALNFKQYIYNHTTPHSYDLYNIYTTYIREDTYSNSNYISDDLDNNQLFENAGRFLELAKNELHKSATYQHSISSNINNLINIKEFKPLLDKFNLGNWIRVKEDETIYRLRLISYSIDFDNITKLNTEFSDVTITANGLNDVMSVIKQATSMASSYSYTQQQAEQGSNVKVNYIDDWVTNGLNSALIRINNNDDEDVSVDNTGILARSYDDVADTHSPEQLRITHNVIAFTDNNWQSVKTALGKFTMTHHHIVNDDYGGLNTNAGAIDTYETYGLVADAVLAGWIVGSHMESSTIIGSHFQNPGNSMYIDLTESTASGREWYVKTDKFRVKKNGTVEIGASDSVKLSLDTSGNLSVSGKITATSGKIGNWNITSTVDGSYGKGALYAGTPGSSGGVLFSPNGHTVSSFVGGENQTWKIMAGTGFGVTSAGTLYATGANISGTITATSGTIGAWTLAPTTGTQTYGQGALYYLPSGNTMGYDTSALLSPKGYKTTSSGASASSPYKRFGWSTTINGQSVTWALGISNNFGVTTSGTLYATGAVLSGTISASSGNIGGWNINSSGLYKTVTKTSGSTTVSHETYMTPNYLYMVESSVWRQFLVNPGTHQFGVAVGDSDDEGFVVTNNTSSVSHTRSLDNGGAWIRISPTGIKKNDGATAVWNPGNAKTGKIYTGYNPSLGQWRYIEVNDGLVVGYGGDDG